MMVLWCYDHEALVVIATLRTDDPDIKSWEKEIWSPADNMTLDVIHCIHIASALLLSCPDC